MNKALAEIEKVTHKKVFCDKIIFIPFHGFTFDHLKIFDKNGSLIFSSRSVSINARILPFFREKKIIIDRFVIDFPVYDTWPEPEKMPKELPPKTVISGEIDVPVIPENPRLNLKYLANGPDFFLPENVYIEQIEIKNGVLFVRKNKWAAPEEEIQSINIRMGFDKPPLLRFEGEVKLGHDSYATVDLKGQWDLEKDRYDFYLSTLSRKVPSWLVEYQKKHFLILREGEFSLKTHLISGKRSEVLFQSEAHLKNALMQVSPTQYSGQMHLEAKGVFDTAWKRFENYKGRLELVRVSASQVSPKIEKLDNLSGLLTFEPDLFIVQSIRGKYKNVDFEASGSVRSFRDLILNGKIHSHLAIDELMALLPPEAVEKLKDFKINGNCEAITFLNGSLKGLAKIQTDSMLSIRNATVQNETKKINWTNLSGQLHISAQGIEISRAHLLLAKIPYALDAFIPKKEEIPGWFRVQSKNLAVKSDFTMHGNDLWLEHAKALLPGASASFNGKLVGWNDPWLDLRGEAEISLNQLASEWSSKMPALKSFAPEGTLRGPFILNGRWNQPLEWEFKMDAESPLVRLQKKISLEQFQIQIRMKNHLLNAPYIHAQFGGGTLGCRALFDLSKPGTFFDSRFRLSNVALAKVGLDLDPSKKNLSGTLVAQAALRGTLEHPESYRGQGAFSVTQGLLWQTTQFKAMGNLPLVRVEGLDLVTFHEMNATFQIHDKKIHTEDLSLLGDSVNLSLHGNISFDSKLDMMMNIQYSDAVYRGAAETGGFVPMVVERAGDFISKYHVHGNLKEPKYDKMLLPI